MLPEAVARLVKKGAQVLVEQGLGESLGIPDAAYAEAGAELSGDRAGGLGKADVVLRLNKPAPEEIALLRAGCIHIGFVDPFFDPAITDALVARGVSTIAMEMIPRTTLAQKMDALSSQANLAGYVAVLLAAGRLPQVFPMMMTPAGTLKPSRVFVMGVGVAGLQAIATAKRLGARVEAFDTRPVVEEQVQSLGAKFVKIDLGETGQTKDGYAVELTPEQKQRQQEGMAKIIAQSDVVIAAAQVFGRRAPKIVSTDMVRGMRPGSVVVDCAVETGGNVECTLAGEEALVNGVRVLGYTNLAGQVAYHASQMYAANLVNLIEHFWDKDSNALRLNLEDEIMDGCLIAHEGALRSAMLRKARENA
jgi:NAD(P) transhydrogenase subunit alpha